MHLHTNNPYREQRYSFKKIMYLLLGSVTFVFLWHFIAGPDASVGDVIDRDYPSPPKDRGNNAAATGKAQKVPSDKFQVHQGDIPDLAQYTAKIKDDTKSQDLKELHDKLLSEKKGMIKKSTAVTSASGFNMNIMTFNLRFATDSDGRNAWRFRRSHVADIINRFRATFLGIQEGLGTQLQELDSDISYSHGRFGTPREPNGEHVQIFYDKDVVEFIDGGNFWLSETPEEQGEIAWDAACLRMATYCNFKLKSTGQRIFVMNTQFDHVGPESQRKSAELVTSRLKTLVPEEDTIVFVMGDFNTYRHTEAYSILTTDDGASLNDAWNASKVQTGTVSYTYHGWQGPLKPEEAGAAVGENHIDWILFKPRDEVTVHNTTVITETRGPHLYPSDHYPIVTNVTLPANKIIDVSI